MSELPGLALEDLAFSFPGGPEVLESVSLEVPGGGFLALLGPSGCGKTTLLRVIAGLQTPTRGTVRVGQRVLTDSGSGIQVAPQSRGVGMVFQDWALLPHLDVAGNVMLGMPRSAVTNGTLLAETLDMVGLTGLAHRRPHELSGGQQQRVAVGRALAQRPDVLLLDEPFSNLDPSLRARVRTEVTELLRSLGTTTVLVTHDREEALVLGDRLALLHHGRVQACGDPVELYRDPPTRFAADFLGEVVRVPGTSSGGRVHTELGVMSSPGAPDGGVEVHLRPEQLVLGGPDDPSGGSPGGATGRVTGVAFHGTFTRYTVVIGAGGPRSTEVVVVRLGPPVAPVGSEVTVHGPRGTVSAWIPCADGPSTDRGEGGHDRR